MDVIRSVLIVRKAVVEDDNVKFPFVGLTQSGAVRCRRRDIRIGEVLFQETLDIFVLGNIDANTSLSYYLDNKKICTYKSQTDNLYLELVSGKDEISLADNTVNVSLSSFSQYKLGDINFDGHVNVNDVTALQRHLANIMTLTSDQLAVADANGDGVVDINDATYLQMYLAEYNVALGKQS